MSSSLTTSAPQDGLIVQQEDAGVACQRSRAIRVGPSKTVRGPAARLLSYKERSGFESLQDDCSTDQDANDTSCGLAAKAALLQGADRGFESLQDYFSDAMPRYANWQSGPARALNWSPDVCRFESCSGYCRQTDRRLGRQLADHLGLEPGMLWVRLPPEPLATTNYVLVEQRSARLPVTQEIVGSNPIGDARQLRRGTQTGKAAKLKPS